MKKTEPAYKENPAAESAAESLSDSVTVWLLLLFITVFFAVAANYQSQQTAIQNLQVLAKK